MSSQTTPPELIGFKLGSLLGRGGMSTVWEAHQLSLERDVAIKVLDPALSQDPEDVKNFVVEARLAAKLSHINLVRVFDVAHQSGVYFYVMELIRGYDAGAWLQRKGQLDPFECLAMAESLAVALDYAWHQVGLIHCDIKPANILIDADGTVKLSDLGVARSLRGLHHTHATERDEITGTPDYMSPEQVTGEAPLDCRTDMYALGATLYHMVTGRKLFPAGDEDAVMQQQCSDIAPDARESCPDLPENYCALLEKLLAKQQTDRPRNWSVALQDMALVRRGDFPTGQALAAGSSSMLRHRPAARLIVDDDEPQAELPPAPVPPPAPVAEPVSATGEIEAEAAVALAPEAEAPPAPATEQGEPAAATPPPAEPLAAAVPVEALAQPLPELAPEESWEELEPGAAATTARAKLLSRLTLRFSPVLMPRLGFALLALLTAAAGFIVTSLLLKGCR